ncbi:MAG TPA: hypothetical protein VHU13_06740 [Solirubrobacteraceae bacterium]|nr:hypothetical protein [Solirubrobacteraceae bacterium]
MSVMASASAVTTRGAQSESGNPINDEGSSYHYRTYVTKITPDAPGLNVEVLEFADRLLLRNHTGETVTIYGYSGEPYARIGADGATEQNVHSPAVYLNTNFYANVTVPPSASPGAQPKWVALDRTGQLEWHDHRIHWMSPVKPPQVTDEGSRTKIFAWSIPIRVGSQPGAIDGELYWVPQSSKAPTAAVVVLVAIVALGALIVLTVRRRRPQAPGSDVQSDVGNEPAGGEARPGNEAW